MFNPVSEIDSLTTSREAYALAYRLQQCLDVLEAEPANRKHQKQINTIQDFIMHTFANTGNWRAWSSASTSHSAQFLASKPAPGARAPEAAEALQTCAECGRAFTGGKFAAYCPSCWQKLQHPAPLGHVLPGILADDEAEKAEALSELASAMLETAKVWKAEQSQNKARWAACQKRAAENF